MEISQMLLKRELDRVFMDVNSMLEDLQDLKTSEAEESKNVIERKMKQLQGLDLSLQFMNQSNQWTDLTDLYHGFRQVKVELRLTRRKIKRMQTTEARLKKMQMRESHVETFVA